jgi:hypothetical protein
LGEVPVEKDGSFFLQLPANIPIQLQTVDDDGMALNTCGWIWVRNHEARGCIGCHEDPELAPENVLVDAVKKAPFELTLPAHLRRTVNFRRHVSTIITEKCASVSCHARAEASLPITQSKSAREVYEMLVSSERYLHPGEARTSPLIWHVTGRNTSRSWDLISTQHKGALPDVSSTISDRERNVLVEWIDMGAAWDHEEVLQEGSAAGVKE